MSAPSNEVISRAVRLNLNLKYEGRRKRFVYWLPLTDLFKTASDIIRHVGLLLTSMKPEETQIVLNRNRKFICNIIAIIIGAILIAGAILVHPADAYKSGSSGSTRGVERMVRLCIASVDPVKLTSQCVMCNRREFPLTVIDCTGITKVNDLIASPLSVQEATCLIYNCRRQVPDIKPEPYHGSVSHAANYRGAATNYHSSSMGGPTSGSNIYEMMTPSGMFGSGYPMYPSSSMQTQHSSVGSTSPYMTRFGSSFAAANPYQTVYPPFASTTPRGLIGGPSLGSNQQQALPYALVPAPRTFPFGK